MSNEIKISFFLIWKQITRGNKWTLIFTIFLMAAAFINLIFVTSLFNGIIEMANNQVIDTLSGHISISPPQDANYIADRTQVLEQIKTEPRVRAASAQTAVPATMEYKNIKGNWQILAIDPNQEKEVTNISNKMMSGSYLNENDTNQIIIGRQIAGGKDVEMNASSFKGANVGEKVTLEINGHNTEMTIKGIFFTKYMIADRQAFITQKEWQGLMPQTGDKANNISIRLDKKGGETEVINDLKAKGIDGTFYTWEDNASLMKTVTSSFVSINALLTTVGILIAAITIFIVIYVDIVNKKQQIGILRAIGIKAYIIRMAYVIQSVIYSVLGIMLGTAVYFSIINTYFNNHPFALPIGDATLLLNYGDFVLRADIVVTVAIVAGLIPVMAVTRIKILDAIWGK